MFYESRKTVNRYFVNINDIHKRSTYIAIFEFNIPNFVIWSKHAFNTGYIHMSNIRT